MKTVGFIGVGNMATAILKGALRAGVVSAGDVGLYDINPQSLAPFVAQGCTQFPSVEALVAGCTMVILAVKPQQFDEILPLVKAGLAPDTVIVSIAAGITPARLRKTLGDDAKIVLAMPNTPLLVGKGATTMAALSPTNREDFAKAKAFFEAAGRVEEIPAEKMNESIPVHGSSPAFIYEFARVIAQCAKEVGIEEETALSLISQTLIGAGTMLLESGKTPIELIDMVSSPGGTTLAGLKALDDAQFSQAIENAFSATIWRGRQLAGINPMQEGVSVREVDYGSEAYRQAKKLRVKLLREPQGLSFLETDEETDQQATHICAFIEGRVVGTCQLVETNAFSTKIGQVAVDPSLQKSGVGTLLLWKADQIAMEKGYSSITVNSRMSAKNFYMRQGFLARGSSFLIHGLPHVAMYKEFVTKP